MKKRIYFIFSLLLCLLFSLTPVHASETIIKDMNVEVYINENGSAHIKEIWDMNITRGTEVYKVMNNMGPSQIKNLKVQDEKGFVYKNIGDWNVDATRQQKNGKCGLVKRDDNYELCFGIGNYGERTYIFEYDVTHFVKQYQDNQGLNYAFFSDMDISIEHALITVASPHPFNEDTVLIWAFGYHGNVVFKDDKVVLETENSMSGGKMQLLMRINDGTFENAYQTNENFDDILADAKQGSDYDSYNNYDENDDNYFIPGMISRTNRTVGLFIFLPFVMFFCLIVFGVIFAAKKYRQEPSVFSDYIPFSTKNVNMFRDIPCQKDIFEFYYLAKKAGLIGENDRGGMIAALILKWVQEGYIRFDKREESHMVFFKKDGFSIDLDKSIPCHNRLDSKMLQYFREAAGENRCLETKEFDKWCRNHYTSIDSWFDDIDSFIEEEYRRKGLISIEKTDTHFMGMKISKDRDVFDASIREEMEHIVGLKMFLEEMSLINEKEVIEVKLWEEYLIFASILGIADKVQEQLGEMCPTFNQQSNLDIIYTMHMVHMFAYNSMQASRAAASAAQSASSGFGGGSSFGGGGGGFSGGGGGGVR